MHPCPDKCQHEERLRAVETSTAQTTAILVRVEDGLKEISSKLNHVAETQAAHGARLENLSPRKRLSVSGVKAYAAMAVVGAAIAWGPKAVAALIKG